MLSKSIGPTGLFSLSATTGTFTATTTVTGTKSGYVQTLVPHKVRIAVTAPACIAFGTTASNNSDILMPANTVEHFSISSTTISYVLATGGTTGTISITPVA